MSLPVQKLIQKFINGGGDQDQVMSELTEKSGLEANSSGWQENLLSHLPRVSGDGSDCPDTATEVVTGMALWLSL